ncbi:DUF3990 domain-containing protein [Halobacillus campisalis]|uniref:DUF3990 domain-containing protein n=1 Tax=Halobacillus campisalis TaxID=435909 RepID=A0ABW2K6Y1_9BACI|nr:DUF3990 domain-containing protein [Halobacillus campisalis]
MIKLDSFKRCFHGTTDFNARNILRGIDISKGRYSTDFGKGFYLTSSYDQALDWANKMRRGSIAIKPKPALVVIELNIDYLNEIMLDSQGEVFTHPNEEWARFVYNCRQKGYNNSMIHDYDFVAGPLADGLIDKEMFKLNKGKITNSQFIENIKPRGRMKDQISFHKTRVLECIITKEVIEYEYSV